MNPGIEVGEGELVRWLAGFANSHAKRESPRIEAVVEQGEGRLTLRLALGTVRRPAPPLPPIELATAVVATGRTRFDWCQALAGRIRTEARALLAAADQARPA